MTVSERVTMTSFLCSIVMSPLTCLVSEIMMFFVQTRNDVIVISPLGCVVRTVSMTVSESVTSTSRLCFIVIPPLTSMVPDIMMFSCKLEMASE
jgi:hypothetical protein